MNFNEKNLGIWFPWETEMLVENDANGSPIYVGYCHIWDITKTSEAIRKIVKYTYDVNWSVIKRQYASTDFNQVWDDRVSLF